MVIFSPAFMLSLFITVKKVYQRIMISRKKPVIRSFCNATQNVKIRDMGITYHKLFDSKVIILMTNYQNQNLMVLWGSLIMITLYMLSTYQK